MAKKVAVLAVNPVNGFGLFQYLEAFFENAISYKLSIVRVKNGKIDEKNTSSFSGDFKYIKNFFYLI